MYRIAQDPGFSRAFVNHAAMNGTSGELPFHLGSCHQYPCQWCILLGWLTFELFGASVVNPWILTTSVPSRSAHDARPWLWETRYAFDDAALRDRPCVAS
jgi:hypothetical protein